MNSLWRILGRGSLMAMVAGWMPFCGCMAQKAEGRDTLPTERKTLSRMVGMGAANILDTYLSPEKYQGMEVRYLSHATHPTRWHHVAQTMVHQGHIAVVNNRADYRELAGAYNFQYHLRRHWQPVSQLYLAAGAGIDLNLGFLYNTRNSNNPAQARASFNLAPSVSARYDCHNAQWAVRLGYEAMAPLLGIMFSPNYGQSYYEIFDKGNNDHNIVPTTIGSTPSLRQLVTIDLRPRKRWRTTWVRIGYLGDYQQARVNHLKYHDYSHLLILGYVKGI